jgi:hypothetical protein
VHRNIRYTLDRGHPLQVPCSGRGLILELGLVFALASEYLFSSSRPWKCGNPEGISKTTIHPELQRPGRVGAGNAHWPIAPTERETIKNGNDQSVVHLNIVARSSIEPLSFGAIATELHVAPPSRVVPASIQEEPSTGFLTAFANVVNVR